MRGATGGQLSRIAPLLARIWRWAPRWLRGAITWAINGKVIVGVSGVLLNDADQILLLRHRFHNTSIWGMPGGWLSPGESVSDCWRREIREELALSTTVEAIICHRATRRTLEFFLIGRISGGQMKIDDVEILEARFFSAGDLPPMERPHLRVIEQAFSQVQEKETGWTVEETSQARSGWAVGEAGKRSQLSGQEEPKDGSRVEGDTLDA